MVNHLNEGGSFVTDEMVLEPRGHVFDYLIVVADNICYNGVVWCGSDHKLKKGVAWVNDVLGLGESPLYEVVGCAGVLAVPAVKTMHVFEWLIVGEHPRHGDLIGSNGLLMKMIEALDQLVLQKVAKFGMGTGSDRLINEGSAWNRAAVKLGL